MFVQHNPDKLFPQYPCHSHATEIRGQARLLFISGLNGYLEDGRTMPEPFDEQAEIIWRHIGTLLHAADMGFSNIVSLRTYLANPSFDEANMRARVKFLGSHRTSLTVVCCQLLDPAWKLEVEAVAAAPIDRKRHGQGTPFASHRSGVRKDGGTPKRVPPYSARDDVRHAFGNATFRYTGKSRADQRSAIRHLFTASARRSTLPRSRLRHKVSPRGKTMRYPNSIRQNADSADWVVGIVTVDPALLDDTAERVDITLPRRVLKRLDALALAAGETRLGYIAHLTIQHPRRTTPALIGITSD